MEDKNKGLNNHLYGALFFNSRNGVMKQKTFSDTFKKLTDKFIVKVSFGYIETASNMESTLVPKCFAVGTCTKKNTKKMTLAMIDTILNDFKGGK